MQHLPTDEQVLALYRGVLVPWEADYSQIEKDWKIEIVAKGALGLPLEVESTEQSEIVDRLQRHLDLQRQNFFVLVRGKSQGRDLFRHLRNAVAHAGITRHAEPDEGAAVLRFRAPSSSKKAMVMAGQIQERLLPAFIASLQTMANDAKASASIASASEA